jgi:hypothetical protein|tara:strand:+ start:1102 stop:1437 length:336 start_codon:yes stop_codon:yes gene_type:complete
MAKYAKGKYAFGFCDRTGFRYKLKDLVPQIKAGRMTGLMVGKDMLDKDQPQNFLGRLGDYSDPQAIKDPRPDLSQDISRKLFAFDPVGNGNGGGSGNIVAHGQVGTVTVTT